MATAGGGGGNSYGGESTTLGTQSRTPSATGRGYVSSARVDSEILSSGGGNGYGGGSDVTRSTDERTSRTSRTSHNNTASTSKKSKRLSFGRKPRAEVSWADRKGEEAEKYTFFRDPTPPPPEQPFEKPFAGTAVGASTYDYQYDHVAPPAPLPQKERKCGLRRRTLWIILAVLLIVIAIGVGAGVGVSLSQNNSSSSDSSTASKDGDSISTSSTSTAPSETTSTAPARTTATSRAFCPAANDTEFSVLGSDKTFLRLCGVDYSGEFGGASKAVDIGMVWTKSMEDCIINCAGYPGCTGCGWGVIKGDEGSDHRCWLKTKLAESHVARPGWEFAILQ